MHQFVAGVQDAVLQDKLFAIENCTLQKALDTASQYEAMRRAANSMRGQAQDEAVYRVASSNGRGHKDGAKQQRPEPVCYYCAGSHLAPECRADRSKLFCTKCKATGHDTRVCKGGRKGKRKPKGGRQDSGAQSGPEKPAVNQGFVQVLPSHVEPLQVQQQREQQPQPPRSLTPPLLPLPLPIPLDCSSYDFDSEGRFCVTGQDEDVPPIMVPVEVHGKNHLFHLDCGAGRTMVGMDTYSALPNPPPPHSNTQGFPRLGTLHEN